MMIHSSLPPHLRHRQLSISALRIDFIQFNTANCFKIQLWHDSPSEITMLELYTGLFAHWKVDIPRC